MPALGAMDPADLEARVRVELGFSRQLEQPWQVAPHPSLGGSSGYPVWHCEEQLERWDAGEVTDVSKQSFFRWSRRLKPYRQTGNRERSQIIGTKLIDLVTYTTSAVTTGTGVPGSLLAGLLESCQIFACFV